MNSDILLITPPFTQLNTPYPATAYLKGFLNTKNISSGQIDLGIDVINSIFSKKGLHEIFESTNSQRLKNRTKRVFLLKKEYINTIDHVISFLKGQNQTLAYSICSGEFLPESNRFNSVSDLDWAFGQMGIQDKAKYLATLYLEDLSDFIIEQIDQNFGFSRYAERISSSAHEFDDIYNEIQKDNSYIINKSLEILNHHILSCQPKIIAFTIPFPGNLFSALKCCEFIKSNYPEIKTVFGGGYVNTELRSIADKRFFNFVDFLCLDDGEATIEQVINHIISGAKIKTLKRTFCLIDDKIQFFDNPAIKDYSQAKVGTPDYSGLDMNQYFSVIEVSNPMHSLWSDGRWNKLTMAHGCYWAKCTFCDISLSYIKDYEPVKASLLCDRIETLIESTGETGFHFVDEAAPPSLMKSLAIEILKRDIKITWWTNIRFEKSFTRDLCELLKISGCIAVSGGLEVASDRLLKLIDKGTTLEQITKVTDNFKNSGIMVHAYLMYGFPTQTDLETINSLEIVRQLFEEGLINSGFWHQFAMTAHSPVGLNPNSYKVESILNKQGQFANNDRPHIDPTGCDHQKYSEGLKKSIFNYMHGIGFEVPLQNWFNFKIKLPTISHSYINGIIEANSNIELKDNSIVIWTNHIPDTERYSHTKKGKTINLAKMEIHSKNNVFKIKGQESEINIIRRILLECSVKNEKRIKFKDLVEIYESNLNKEIDYFINSENFHYLKNNGLLFI